MLRLPGRGAPAVALVLFLALPSPASAASASVAALQVALRAHGVYPGEIDGLAGPGTRRAVRRFQRRRGLAADGVAGPRTRRALGSRGRPRVGARVMRRPQRGWDVAALQFMLLRRGFSGGSIDGVLGARTARALRSFQRAAGLAPDGRAGPATLAALRRPVPLGPVRFVRPVAGRIGDGFGPRGASVHTGLDFPAAHGTPVGAAGVGTVVFAGWDGGGYGNLVIVRHRLGFSTWYAHLDSISTRPGAAVSGGVRLGRVGSTGRSDGPHLHFEARRYGTPVDPAPYLLP